MTLFNCSCCIFLALRYLRSPHQEDERNEQLSEVRAQLKFFEQLDQMEKQKKEEQEREILLKAAKVMVYYKGKVSLAGRGLHSELHSQGESLILGQCHLYTSPLLTFTSE